MNNAFERILSKNNLTEVEKMITKWRKKTRVKLIFTITKHKNLVIKNDRKQNKQTCSTWKARFRSNPWTRLQCVRIVSVETSVIPNWSVLHIFHRNPESIHFRFRSVVEHALPSVNSVQRTHHAMRRCVRAEQLRREKKYPKNAKEYNFFVYFSSNFRYRKKHLTWANRNFSREGETENQRKERNRWRRRWRLKTTR